jgi:hypothetical protein
VERAEAVIRSACGTLGGARRHEYRNELRCDACREAERLYVAERRRKAKAANPTPVKSEAYTRSQAQKVWEGYLDYLRSEGKWITQEF